MRDKKALVIPIRKNSLPRKKRPVVTVGERRKVRLSDLKETDLDECFKKGNVDWVRFRLLNLLSDYFNSVPEGARLDDFYRVIYWLENRKWGPGGQIYEFRIEPTTLST